MGVHRGRYATQQVMPRLQRRALLAWGLVTGCAPAPPAWEPPAPPVRPSVASATPRAATPPISTASSTAAPSTSVAPPPTRPSACPDDMVLVDGDYCESLRVDCLEQFEAPQNHLWVCLRVREPTVCTGARRPMRYCIDRYEFPNRVGERPMVMQNFYQAQVHCANAGKRVCTESEWTKACEGPDDKPFPYGYVRDARKCNGDHPWDSPDKQLFLERDARELERLWKGVPSGSQPDCVSDYGVQDLPGNADELAASESHSGRPRSDFANVTTGGPWYHGVRNMCRPKIYTHDENFAYYYLSWRCCREADGAPTNPRAPKQIERGMPWSRVVELAETSWKLPFNPLLPGDPGYTSSGPKNHVRGIYRGPPVGD